LCLICRLYNIELRTFRRQFLLFTGISPKAFSRIVRINHIVEEMGLKPNLSINDLVYKYNYFDQAHFINDFKRIMGETPVVFRNKEQQITRFLSGLR
jgi:methylphosphotriester-DNA--protein-cysteine methyltransferase